MIVNLTENELRMLIDAAVFLSNEPVDMSLKDAEALASAVSKLKVKRTKELFTGARKDVAT